jgi:serine/threonine-protein kinase
VTSPTEHLRDGQTFGRYQIVRILGEGGMGAVYEAVHTGLKKRFAIKTLLPSIARNPEAQARFLREGEAASRINHPNVVDVTDVGTESGVPYLVMEYLEGETLGDLVGRKGPLGVELAMDLLVPVLSAVSAGHDRGVIHRDLKPANVFLARGPWGERAPKVLDFGVSKIIGGENPALTGTMSVLGTASYMSPEQARGAKVVDAATDQYALGLICYEMLTGTRAHAGDSPLEVLHKIATGTVPSVRGLRPELPEELDSVIMRMLATTPGERHASLRAVAKALLPFASERIRVSYQASFEDAPAAGRLTGPMVLPTPQVGGTMILPDEGSAAPPGGPSSPKRAVAETRVLPPKPDTTLGHGATESSASTAVPRAGRGRIVLAAAAIAAAAVILVVRFVGSPRPSAAAPAVTARPAPSAEPTGERAPPPPAPTTTPAPPSPPPQAPVAMPAPATLPTTGKREAEPAARTADESADQHGASHRHHVHRSSVETRSEPQTPAKPAAPARRGANNAPILD